MIYIGLTDTQLQAFTWLLALISGLGLIVLGWLLARSASHLGSPTPYDYGPDLEDYYGREVMYQY